jgi:hypothetical protein
LQTAADRRGAGEGDLVDSRVIEERRSHIASAGDNVDNSGWQVRIGNDLSQYQDRQRCGFGWLDHYRVSGRQRRRDLPGGHQQRKVPGDDLSGHSQRSGHRP